jgi:hypothetical protein
MSEGGAERAVPRSSRAPGAKPNRRCGSEAAQRQLRSSLPETISLHGTMSTARFRARRSLAINRMPCILEPGLQDYKVILQGFTRVGFPICRHLSLVAIRQPPPQRCPRSRNSACRYRMTVAFFVSRTPGACSRTK